MAPKKTYPPKLRTSPRNKLPSPVDTTSPADAGSYAALTPPGKLFITVRHWNDAFDDGANQGVQAKDTAETPTHNPVNNSELSSPLIVASTRRVSNTSSVSDGPNDVDGSTILAGDVVPGEGSPNTSPASKQSSVNNGEPPMKSRSSELASDLAQVNHGYISDGEESVDVGHAIGDVPETSQGHISDGEVSMTVDHPIGDALETGAGPVEPVIQQEPGIVIPQATLPVSDDVQVPEPNLPSQGVNEDDEAQNKAEDNKPPYILIRSDMKRKNRILDPIKDSITIANAPRTGQEYYDDDASELDGPPKGIGKAELFCNVRWLEAAYDIDAEPFTPTVFRSFVPGRFERMPDGEIVDQKQKLVIKVINNKGERRMYRNPPPKDWYNQEALTALNKRCLQQSRRNTNNRFREVVTPYLQIERAWILQNLNKEAKPKKGWTILVQEFNEEFKDKILDGDEHPRPMRSKSSITKEVDRHKTFYQNGEIPQTNVDQNKRDSTTPSKERAGDDESVDELDVAPIPPPKKRVAHDASVDDTNVLLVPPPKKRKSNSNAASKKRAAENDDLIVEVTPALSAETPEALKTDSKKRTATDAELMPPPPKKRNVEVAPEMSPKKRTITDAELMPPPSKKRTATDSELMSPPKKRIAKH